MKKTVIGIIAHVDAGKTTLSEALMYSSGAITKLGRVDRGDAYLDTDRQERARGITIFSKQAVFEYGESRITLIDTPGHVDFSCEAERALSVQDYCILVISAPDGVTAHTKTLWQLLRKRRLPTFIFINKMDMGVRTRRDILAEIKNALSSHCVDFSRDRDAAFYEDCASADEKLIEEFFATDTLTDESISDAIAKEKLFPCYFGSALQLTGVKELLTDLDLYTKEKKYSESLFGARVYKISRDERGRRISFAKITGGTLRPKDIIRIRQGGEIFTEKLEEIREYSADKSKPLKAATPGTVVALIGPVSTRAGMGLGFEEDDLTTLTPVLSYRIKLSCEVNVQEFYQKLSAIAEEDPSLSVRFDPDTSDILVNLMGEIQLEVLSELIKERTGISVEFDEGKILYKETVADTVFGAGHFEPLRHYAEVHVRIDPLPEGSGVIAATDCDVDALATSWQRLVMTHIEERTHKGVLIGAPLTDVKITLVAGRAHLKHTEGGDFRQATYRAIRQGLMKAKSVILEPIFKFTIDLPEANLGRAMTDVTNMGGRIDPPSLEGGRATLTGSCPVSKIKSYPITLRAYTKGEGYMTLTQDGYAPATDEEKIIQSHLYNPDLDERNPAGSVFCKGGAGYFVPWNEADELMHLTPAGVDRRGAAEYADDRALPLTKKKSSYEGTVAEDKELIKIFEATYGKIKPRAYSEQKENKADGYKEERKIRKNPPPLGDSYVILDGYNIIFGWDELKKVADSDLALARDTLVRLMCDYTSFNKCKAIVVFDAYRRRENKGSEEKYGAVSVIYTKEAETADSYIEKLTHSIAKNNRVRVVTGDLVEQYIILGNGALRASVREFRQEVNEVLKDIRSLLDTSFK